MNKKDIILYASIAGGAYLAYWYITHYGPHGAVSAGSVSYWDTWFGSSVAAPAGPGTTPVGTTPPVGTTTTPPATATDLRSKILAAAGVSASTMLNADQWNYYRNQIAPPELTPAQFSQAFPNMTADRGPAMTVDQFISAIHGVGLGMVMAPGMGYLSGGMRMGMGMGMGMGDVVNVQSRPTVPMMSYGGALNPAFPGKKGWA